MATRRRFVGLGLAGGAVLFGGGLVATAFARDLSRARERIRAGDGRVIATELGDIECAEAGTGRPLLMIHGTGGGFVHGLLFSRRLIAAGHRVIAPSRFGYLRSPMPPDPSPERQADAFAALLDALDIERVPVVGGSAGALSALQFAIRHPGRCAALVALVPATFAPGRPPARPWSPMQARLARAVLGSDFLFWAAASTAPDTLLRTLLATDPELLEATGPAERERVRDILRTLLPVGASTEGLLLDARLAGDPPPMALGDIVAPTLAISLEDDAFLTADAARHIAASVPGARLLLYPSGGHVWVGRDAEIFDAIGTFLGEAGDGLSGKSVNGRMAGPR